MLLTQPSSLLKYKVTRFAGSTQHITMGDPAALQKERNQAFSLFAWVKFASGHLGVIIGKTGTSNTIARGYDLHLNGDRTFGVNLNNDFVGNNYIGVTTTAAFPVNTWHHVGFTYDGSSTAAGIVIYVNGTTQTNNVLRDTLSATILTTATFRIGHRDVAVNPLPFAGLIHDGAIWSSTLSASDVSNIHASHCPPDLTAFGPTANLVGYWLCGEHKGDANLVSDATSFPTVPDASTNSNAGTMTNMTAAALETRR